MFSYESMSAIVTGAARGIGLATARLLHERGARVALLDVDASAGEAALHELDAKGERAIFIHADLACASEVEAAVARAGQTFGNLNALVNNAGVQRYGIAEETTLELWHEVLSINLTSCFLTARASIPFFRQAGGGAIVNVGSVQSHVSQRGAVAYVTSKHALLGLTRALAVDHAHERIRVNCVCPGTVDTPMFRHSAALDPDPASMIEACRGCTRRGASHVPQKSAK